MNYAELNDLSVEELKSRLAAEKSNARNLRFAHAVSPLENPMRIRQSRKNIARLLTAISKRSS